MSRLLAVEPLLKEFVLIPMRKLWLMSHERVTRLSVAGKMPILAKNCCGQPAWLCQTSGLRRFTGCCGAGLATIDERRGFVVNKYRTKVGHPAFTMSYRWVTRLYHVIQVGHPPLPCHTGESPAFTMSYRWVTPPLPVHTGGSPAFTMSYRWVTCLYHVIRTGPPAFTMSYGWVTRIYHLIQVGHPHLPFHTGGSPAFTMSYGWVTRTQKRNGLPARVAL